MMFNPSSEITCIVPTHNRPHFLRRLLTFWSTSGAQIKTLIADSSTSDFRKENESVVRDFSQRLPLQYEHFELGMLEKMAESLDRVRTPYVFLCADDDFIVPETVGQCLKFLETSPEYVCAHGMVVGVETMARNRCRLQRGFDLSSPSALQRFGQMPRHWYSTFYGTYRTPVQQECFRVLLQGPSCEQARIYFEFMHCQMTVLLGRVKFLPRMYGICQAHGQNYSYVVPPIQDAAQNEKHYRLFQKILAGQVQRCSDLDWEASTKLVDDNLGYLAHGHEVKKQRKSLVSRLQREFMRVVRRTQGAFTNTAVLERKTFSSRNKFWQDPAWQLAYRLIREFPNGMTSQQSLEQLSKLELLHRRVA